MARSANEYINKVPVHHLAFPQLNALSLHSSHRGTMKSNLRAQTSVRVLLFLGCITCSVLWNAQPAMGSLDWLTGMLHRIGAGGGYGGYGGGLGGYSGGFSGYGGYGSALHGGGGGIGSWLTKFKDLLGGKKGPQAHGSGWVGGGGPYTSAGFYGSHGSGFNPWYGRPQYNRLGFNRLGGHLFLRRK